MNVLDWWPKAVDGRNGIWPSPGQAILFGDLLLSLKYLNAPDRKTSFEVDLFRISPDAPLTLRHSLTRQYLGRTKLFVVSNRALKRRALHYVCRAQNEAMNIACQWLKERIEKDYEAIAEIRVYQALSGKEPKQ